MFEKGSFPQSPNDGPKIHPWWETAPEPSLYGLTKIEGTTFANFGSPCTEGPRENTRDVALACIPSGAHPADGLGPLTTKEIEKVAVDDDSLLLFHKTDKSWINGADCVDMVSFFSSVLLCSRYSWFHLLTSYLIGSAVSLVLN